MTGTDRLPSVQAAGRGAIVRHQLGERGLAAMAVLDLTNVRWLTGFGGSSAMVALTPDRIVLVTDPRYADRAAVELAAAGVEAELAIGATPARQHELLVDALRGCGPVGAEAARVTHARWQSLAVELHLEPADAIIEQARRVKDSAELARIGRAAECADAALAEVVPIIQPGVTEADIRDELEYLMRRHGADGPSYDTIVASGPEHAARPHHLTGRRPLAAGDTLVIDVGALVDGYHSDMTRSFVIGEPSPQQLEIYTLLHAVQAAGLAAVGAGVAARDVDATCRALVAEAGYAEWFLHSTGHGVGLAIHEEPFEAPTSTAVLQAGEVVTVEPGLYRVGFGGFRIEDLVEVTESGCRTLTTSPKDSPCLPSPPTT